VIGLRDPRVDRLYELMPAVYRERDAEVGYPLRGLLQIVAEQAVMVEDDIRGLYKNLFIETCEPWVIPYIGDLVSNDLVFDAARTNPVRMAESLFGDLIGKDLRPPIAVRVRTDVAKTIYYRRRKGTLPMLEELARDVTGWPIHAVEFLELLGWNQHLEHVRPQAAWVDVRSVERMDRIEGAFDQTTHSVDVRPVGPEGRYNIRNIGFFAWRLRAYPLRNVPARPAAGASWRYHFSPLGHVAPLFVRWRREGDEAGLATELHVPGPIRRSFFSQDLERYEAATPPRPDFTDLYGLFAPAPPSPLAANPDASISVVRNGVPVEASADPIAPATTFLPVIVCRRLDPWPAAAPTGTVIAIDVTSGRLAVGDGWPDATDTLDVSYHYGFPADMGGGPYDRRKWLIRTDPMASPQPRHLWVKEDGVFPPGTPAGDAFTSLTAALADWASPAIGPERPDALVTILDSRTYPLQNVLTLRNDGRLAIEAADGERPILQTSTTGTALNVHVLPPVVPGDPGRPSALTLSGAVVEGSVRVAGDLGLLRLLHSTIIPGRRLLEDGLPETGDPALVVEAENGGIPINTLLRVQVAFSILGPIRMPEHAPGLWLLDSIVDGIETPALEAPSAGDPAAPTTMERSTLLGEVRVARLDASETIFSGLVETVRTQDGCVRFSYVSPGSRTSRRYGCQPDLVIDREIEEALKRDPSLSQAERDAIRAHVEAWLVPSFTTLRYGQPAYAQLRLRCPVEIRTGAEDGSEMGAFCHLKQPQRESNFRIRLDEYLPFGLDAGLIYVT